MNANLSWLGPSIEPELPNPDGRGYRQRFVGGFIYWSPGTGASAVHNRNVEAWSRAGWEAGWLGYPLTDDFPVKGTTFVDGEIHGWQQNFTGGRIYRTPVMNGFHVASIRGEILKKWEALGAGDSGLGFPVSDESGVPDGVGRFSVFQRGAMYWHPQHGTHQVSSMMMRLWGNTGYETGIYGYPIEDPRRESGWEIQRFQGGELYVPLEESANGNCSAMEIITVIQRGLWGENNFICGGDSVQLTKSLPGEFDAIREMSEFKNSFIRDTQGVRSRRDIRSCTASTPTQIFGPRIISKYKAEASIEFCHHMRQGTKFISGTIGKTKISHYINERFYQTVTQNELRDGSEEQKTYEIEFGIHEDLKHRIDPQRSSGRFSQYAGFGETVEVQVPEHEGDYYLKIYGLSHNDYAGNRPVGVSVRFPNFYCPIYDDNTTNCSYKR